jgi:hypothetical protein
MSKEEMREKVSEAAPSLIEPSRRESAFREEAKKKSLEKLVASQFESKPEGP